MDKKFNLNHFSVRLDESDPHERELMRVLEEIAENHPYIKSPSAALKMIGIVYSTAAMKNPALNIAIAKGKPPTSFHSAPDADLVIETPVEFGLLDPSALDSL